MNSKERSRRWRQRNPLYDKRRKADWYKETKKHNLQRMREWRKELWLGAVKILGPICRCCGETKETMLEIDHVRNNGAEERKADKKNNFKLYQRIRNGEANLNDYQVLCCNCNRSKHKNSGFCQHYTDKWMCWIDDGGFDPGPFTFC